jgi:MFS family permease
MSSKPRDLAGEPIKPAGENAEAPPEAAAFSVEALLSTYLPALVLALGIGIALPAIPTLAKSFNVGFGMASAVITSFLVGQLIGTIPTGWLIDRFGRRKVMIAGPLLTSVMAFLVLTSNSFPQLVIYRFIDGFASQMWLLGRIAVISERGRANQRGRQVSWMFGMDSLGRLTGPLVGGFIAATWGPRAPFAAYGFLALLTVIPVLIYVTDSPAQLARKRSEAEPLPQASVKELVMPRMAFFAVALFASIARGPLFADLFHLYAAFTYNLSARSIGFLATAASSLTLPASFLSGYLLDRFGRRQTMIPGYIWVTIAMIGIAATAFFHLSLWWYVAAFLFTVASNALTGGSIQTLGTDVAPPGARGMFLGLWNFTGRTGTALSPIAFAYIADQAGYPISFLVIAAAAAVVALLLIYKIPDTGRVDVVASEKP